MSASFTITLTKKGVALATVAALVGAGTAIAVDEAFFDSYPEYSSIAPNPAPASGQSLSSSEATTSATTEDNSVQLVADSPAPPATADPATAEPTPGITPADAMRIGAEATGGRAIDVYPGFEAGRDVFYVDVRTGIGLSEVYVDATTGEVLKIERGF